MQAGMQLWALPGMPEVKPGDDAGLLIHQALDAAGLILQDDDVVVIAQKIISKAEDRYRYLDLITPGAEAQKLALECDKDPRLVQLILDESDEVLRVRPGVIIVQHRLGYVHANAGIDRSNLPQDDRERVLLLPQDPDRSCRQLQAYFRQHCQAMPAIVINDSAGRAWRNGTVGFAIGTAGFQPVVNLIGRPDRNNRQMEVTEVAVADELAAAASLLMGQADESCPVVVIRGACLERGDYPSAGLIRDKQMDLFR